MECEENFQEELFAEELESFMTPRGSSYFNC